MKEKTLVLKKTVICGRNYFYPENETSETVLSLTRSASGVRKALTETDVEKLIKLGFELKIMVPTTTNYKTVSFEESKNYMEKDVTENGKGNN